MKLISSRSAEKQQEKAFCSEDVPGKVLWIQTHVLILMTAQLHAQSSGVLRILQNQKVGYAICISFYLLNETKPCAQLDGVPLLGWL